MTGVPVLTGIRRNAGHSLFIPRFRALLAPSATPEIADKVGSSASTEDMSVSSSTPTPVDDIVAH